MGVAVQVPGGFIIFIWMILNLVGVPDKCDIACLLQPLCNACLFLSVSLCLYVALSLSVCLCVCVPACLCV